METFKKVILLILDGWGIGKNDESNPIFLAKTPFIDSLCKKFPDTKIKACGRYVGLPGNQVGNSEAGHMNLGAGRIVDQESVKISKHINTGEFFKNPAFLAAIKNAKTNNSAIHLMGMLSNGQSPHSDPDHLYALISLLRIKHPKSNIYMHLFTDGRDSPPRSSLKAMEALERFLKPNEIIASVIGRYYAMDRKKDWNKTLSAYDAMTIGTAAHKANSPQEGITRAYNADITDEFIEPIVIYQKGKMIRRIKNEDSIIFFNLRSDRARQLTKPFVQVNFEKLNNAPKRKKILKKILFVAMTDFGPDLDSIITAYPSQDLKETLPMMLKEKKQIYISESEKYAHVTFFFNGGYADPVANETRINIPSPNVKSYDETPEMSTAQITSKALSSIKDYDFICINFACPDMIGHTGNIKAGVKTAEAVDKYVKKIYESAISNGAALIITADHGNMEYMLNLETKEIITEHTSNPVPFILTGKGFTKSLKLLPNESPSLVAPTILKLFGIKPSKLMSKKYLILDKKIETTIAKK